MPYRTGGFAATVRLARRRSGVVLGTLLMLAVISWPAALRAESHLIRTPAPGVTFEIVELKRIGGNAVGLVYSVTNGTKKRIGLTQFGVDTGHATYVARLISLVDFKNGKRYGVGRGGKRYLCSVGGTKIPPGQAKQFWAQFAAPPEDVDKIAVLIGNVPPFYDVPIEK